MRCGPWNGLHPHVYAWVRPFELARERCERFTFGTERPHAELPAVGTRTASAQHRERCAHERAHAVPQSPPMRDARQQRPASQPPVKFARHIPRTTFSFWRIRFHTKPERQFSTIVRIGP